MVSGPPEFHCHLCAWPSQAGSWESSNMGSPRSGISQGPWNYVGIVQFPLRDDAGIMLRNSHIMGSYYSYWLLIRRE